MHLSIWFHANLLPWLERELAGPARFFGRGANRHAPVKAGFAMLVIAVALAAGGLDALCRPRPWSTADMIWMGVGALAGLFIIQSIIAHAFALARS